MPSERFIVIIDSDRYLRETLALIIQGGGYHVIPTADVSKAMNRLSTSTCNAAIIDMNASDDTDFQSITRLRAVYPDLPILVLTGSPQIDVAQWVRNYKIISVLQKPVDPSLILNSLMEMLETACSDR